MCGTCGNETGLSSARCARETATRAFSLVELLTVVAIMVMLLALLVPSVRKSMRQASSTVCMHNLREIGRALQQYRMDHRGWLPDVVEPDADGTVDPHGAAWYGRLVPRYLGNPAVLVCPADPARSILDTGRPLRQHHDPANASSYGMNELIRVAELYHLDRLGPARPLETILLADLGPDVIRDGRVTRNNGWLPWDDGYHPAYSGLRDSWLTGRHFGHINVSTIGGAVKRVRTAKLMQERITDYYRDCVAGGCPLCAEHGIAHYSFAPERLYWWTGRVRNGD